MTSKSVLSALTAKMASLLGETGSMPGTEGRTFLVLAIPGKPISPQDLAFSLKTNHLNLSTQGFIRAASDFDRVVNRIPKPSVSWQSDEHLLWQEYQTILTQAIVASSDPTPEEITRFERARNFLYQQKEITDLLGTRIAVVDSPKLATYKKYREAYLQAESQYNSLKRAAQTSTNLKVVQDWRLNASIYKLQVDNAHDAWISSGYKNEVETAFGLIDQIGKLHPQLIWAKWKADFHLSNLKNLENQDFYYTYFYPPDFYNLDTQKKWQTLTLDSSEIESLSSKNIDADRELFSSQDPSVETQQRDLSISSLTADLIKVEIVRPWMNPDLFERRFWKWPDNRELLSSGEQPFQGSLPAYTTHMILARNLKIRLQSESGENAEALQSISASNPISWGPFSLKDAVLPSSNSIQSDGIQIIAFVCQKLLKSPNPDPSLAWPTPEPTPEPSFIIVNWLSGEYRLDPQAKVAQFKVKIGMGEQFIASTDANIQLKINNVDIGTNALVYLKINNGDWNVLAHPAFAVSEKGSTVTYEPLETPNLTVENLSGISIEFKPDSILRLWAWQIEWLRLEINVEGLGWVAYKEWHPGWVDSTKGTSYFQLQ